MRDIARSHSPLTNKIFLTSANLERDKTNNSSEDGQGTEDKRQRKALRGRQNTMNQECKWESVN